MTQRYPHSPYRIPESALTKPALLQAVQEIQDSPVSLVNKAQRLNTRSPQVDAGGGASCRWIQTCDELDESGVPLVLLKETSP